MSTHTTTATPLPIETVRALSRPAPLRAIAATALTWLLVVAPVWLVERHWHPLLYVVAVMWIGNRQHSLLIQMHDGAHRRISDDRRLNDVLAEVFCAWPMFFRMSAYRHNHTLHHRFTNTAKDPDFRPSRFPRSRLAILRMLLTDALALNTLEHLGELKRLKQPSDRRTTILRITYYTAIAVALTVLGGWKVYLLYWIVPLFTWLKVVLRLRAIADHAGLEDQDHPFETRAVVPNLFDAMFLAPRGCSYHLGHHLYPSVPWFNLKRLHVELMKDPAFRARCRVTHGFWRLLLEFPWREPEVEEARRARRVALA